jgi:hypothetical protein
VAVVERSKNPWANWVEAQALHTVALALKLCQHFVHLGCVILVQIREQRLRGEPRNDLAKKFVALTSMHDCGGVRKQGKRERVA